MNILQKIANGNRMPVLFIGSGISKRYLYRYPDWEGMLRMSFQRVNTDPYYYQKYYESLKRKGLSNFEIYTELGSIIEDQFNSAFYERKIKIKGTTDNSAWIKQGVSPFKIFLSMFFKKMKINQDENLQEEIKKFKQLKNKVAAIITTNYDTFLEKEIFSDDFQVFVHQHELFSADSYNTAEIYKIHGSVKDAASLVVTKKDYDEFEASRKLIIAKMLTLFSEAPIIFIGYSFTDENVQKIITDFLGCLSDKDLEHINEHLVFISYKEGQQTLNEMERTIITKNNLEIPITDIQTDNFSCVYDTLNQIMPGVSPVRIRDTKRLVKRIVDASALTNNAESIIIGIDEKTSFSAKPLAIAIGYKEDILNKVGYSVLNEDIIFEDIIFDNKCLNPKSMCEERFKSLSYTHLIPVYKYVKEYGKEIASDSKLGVYIEKHNSVDKIIAKSTVKQLKNSPTIDDFEELKNQITSERKFNKKAGILLKNIIKFNCQQIREICQILFEYNKNIGEYSTHFKRCVMYLDFMENYLQQKS